MRECRIKVDSIQETTWILSQAGTPYKFTKMDLRADRKLMLLFEKESPDIVLHFAAQAGVRYSLDHPHSYIDSNLTGFLNVLEGCRHYPVSHLIFASSSSVYGLNRNIPFSVHNPADHPISLYAATKKSNELMAHAYSHLYNVPVTGLRFFTVYGPWGRPDMALFKFTEAILHDRPIDVYNHGNMTRDFTYIDDIIEGVFQVMKTPAQPDKSWSPQTPNPSTSTAPYRIYNIGNCQPVNLNEFIRALEDALGKKARKNYLPLQPGDVPDTQADMEDMTVQFRYHPKIQVEEGVKQFVRWYLDVYKNSKDL